MADRTTDYEGMGRSERVRLTLRLTPAVRDELKRQARLTGVSPSAYESVLVNERRDRFKGDAE